MKLLTAGIIITALSGCDFLSAPAEVLACEIFIKDGLQAPSTYNRIEYRTHDQPITLDQLRDRHYPPEGEETKSLIESLGPEERFVVEAHNELQRSRFLLYELADELSLRSVFVEYDTDNTYGVPTRSLEQCLFLLKDGELDESRSLESDASKAASYRRFRNLASAGIVDLSATLDLLSEVPPTSEPCCLPR